MKSIACTMGAIAALTLGAGAGFAGGPIDVAPETPVAEPVAVAPDWSGFYAGLGVAMATGDNTFTERSIDAEATPGDWEGTQVYVTGGYNWQSNRLVYGAALDLAAGSIDALGTDSLDYSCGTDGCAIELSKYMALRGRVGLAQGSTLFYGTAGMARADAEAGFTTGVVSGSDTMTGWVAGVGVEHMLNSRLSVDLSYLYNDLGRLEIDDCSSECYTDVTFGQLKLGANFRW